MKRILFVLILLILAGGSAGSLCWFENRISDSRPKELSLVDGLGFH